MGRKRTPGLQLKNGIWHIDKVVKGRRICESTGEADLAKAEEYLAFKIDEIRKTEIYGIRPMRTFEQAAARYLDKNTHKRSILQDARRLNDVMPYIGHMRLDRVHRDALDDYVDDCQEKGNRPGTINHGLKAVRQVLNQAMDWRHENGLTWLDRAPKIKLLDDKQKRKPYPMTWPEQDALFSHLPDHLRSMAQFGVNTGCRDGEICNLRWAWEEKIEQLDTSVFVIPGAYTKNGDDRLVILNDEAHSLITAARNHHPEFVFTYRGKPIQRMLNSAWLRAREKAVLSQVRVHDLKHTFGSRLRNQGVVLEDRQELLGHRAGDISTHYSASEVRRLIGKANKAGIRDADSDVAVILRKRASGF